MFVVFNWWGFILVAPMVLLGPLFWLGGIIPLLGDLGIRKYLGDPEVPLRRRLFDRTCGGHVFFIPAWLIGGVSFFGVVLGWLIITPFFLASDHRQARQAEQARKQAAAKSQAQLIEFVNKIQATPKMSNSDKIRAICKALADSRKGAVTCELDKVGSTLDVSNVCDPVANSSDLQAYSLIQRQDLLDTLGSLARPLLDDGVGTLQISWLAAVPMSNNPGNPNSRKQMHFLVERGTVDVRAGVHKARLGDSYTCGENHWDQVSLVRQLSVYYLIRKEL